MISGMILVQVFMFATTGLISRSTKSPVMEESIVEPIIDLILPLI